MYDTNILLQNSDFITYNNKILNRIQNELSKKKISQKELAKLCNLSQPTISKLLKGDTPLTLKFLYNLCNVLEINIDLLLSSSDTLTDKLSDIQLELQNNIYDNFHIENEAIVSDPTQYPFKGILGSYYFYCNATISSESKLLKGILELNHASRNRKNFCSCKLSLYTGKYDINGQQEIKIYTGMMLISLPMQSCYCILSCDESAEYTFLLFHHMFLIKADLECRIVAVLTTSAGSHRRPTMEKAILSRTKLTDNDLTKIEGQLKMNSSTIKITETDFKEYISNQLPKKLSIPECQKVYFIEEAVIKSSSLSDNEQIELINKLRKYSIEKRYTKISTHADDILYNFISNKNRKKIEAQNFTSSPHD